MDIPKSFSFKIATEDDTFFAELDRINVRTIYIVMWLENGRPIGTTYTKDAVYYHIANGSWQLTEAGITDYLKPIK